MNSFLNKILSFLLFIISASSVDAAIFSNNPVIYDQSNVDLQAGFFTHDESVNPFLNEKYEHLKENYIEVEKYISNGMYGAARDLLESQLKKNNTNPNIYNLLGRLDLLENKIPSAKQNFNKSIALNQSNLFAYQGLARLSLDEKKLIEAKVSIDKMLSIDEHYYVTYIFEAELFYQKNELLQTEQSLLTAYKKANESVADQLRVLSILGKFYTSQNESFKTLQLAKEFYGKHDSSIPAISFYAINLVVNEEPYQAEILLRKIIKLNTKDISHRVFLAKLLSAQPNKADEVIRLFDEAYSLNKKDIKILVLKASFLIKLKKYDQALSAADQLIGASADSAMGYQVKGDIYKAADNNSMAIKMYKLALQKDSGTAAVFPLADLLVNRQQFSEAINLLQLQLGRNNNDSIVFFKLALIYEKKGDLSKAESYYKKVLKISPTHVLALNNLALMYIQHNNSDALKLAENAFKQAKHSAAIADTYGYALVLFGDLKEGLQILEEAVKKAPTILDIQAHLAIAYTRSGSHNKAIQLLEKITQEKQDYPEKENAKKLLSQLR